MKIEEAVYSVLEVLKAITDDSDVSESFVLSRLNSYRADFIAQDVSLTGMVSTSWLQDLPLYTTEKINSGDDPEVTIASVTLGKITIPDVVNLNDDLGIWKVLSPSQQYPYTPVDPVQLFMMISLGKDIYKDYGYYFRKGTSLYIYPYNDRLKLTLLLMNPMDGQVLDSNTWRDRTMQDDWYTDPRIANKAIIAVLTNDFQISQKQLADIINDAQSQLSILQARAG
jgi:hypothetical protein